MSKEFNINGNPARLLDLDIPGWSNARDLLLLATVAQMTPTSGLIIEAGCYLGRSSYAIGRNLSTGSTLHCIDHWSTNHPYFSPDSQVAQFAQGKTKGSWDNMQMAARKARRQGSWYPGWATFTEECDNVIPFKMDIKDYTIDPRTNAVFIDADHNFNSIMADVHRFNINDEVLLIGDDFNQGWPDVCKAIGMVKEETGRTLLSFSDSYTWFLWPTKGYWASRLSEFVDRAARDISP